MTDTIEKPMLRALKGDTLDTPPVWLMRQAGRYLPEYRALRQQAGGFLNMVYNPDLASEVTLQPIRRFGMDGAILFSDILVIPQALGQALRFAEGEGPILDPVRDEQSIRRLSFDSFSDILAPVYETLRQTRAKLNREGFEKTTLIGFSGSPWTLACYMVEGQGSRDFSSVRHYAATRPEEFSLLIDILVQAVTEYCLEQIRAGADAIQLFDSWAGVLDQSMFRQWVITPTRRITDAIKKAAPHIPVIGFPRAAGFMAMDYADEANVDVLGIDQHIAPQQAARFFQSKMPVQGNMDPVCLLAGGSVMEHAAHDVLNHLGKGPFVFNLGHGVIKETPPEHVETLIRIIRSWS